VIDKVGPGGNFIQSPHTFRHFKKESWFPDIMKRFYKDRWEQSGSPDTRERVREKLSKIIQTHQPAALDPSVKAEIEKIRQQGESLL
jgi:trimethylamine--corrinoid protein Co-methyltransferase